MTVAKPTQPGHFLEELDTSLISELSAIEGKMTISGIAKIYGKLQGEVHGLNGSILTIEKSAVVEGKINGDTVFISGVFIGDIKVSKKIHLTKTGKILGTVEAPEFKVDFGGQFEGKAKSGVPRILPGSPNPAPIESASQSSV